MLTKLHLFDLPAPLLVFVIESLKFRHIKRLVELILLSNARGRNLWHTQIKRLLRCPDMENRRYSHESLRWVLKREITIRNFTIKRELRKQNYKWTELHYACKSNRAWLARAGITFNGPEINTSDKRGKTPMHLACEFADVDMVKLLLFSGAESSLYHKTRRGFIPIDIAVRERKVGIVELLLSYHKKDKKRSLESLSQAFLKAAEYQQLESVKHILDICGPEILNSRCSDTGSTALHLSCEDYDNTEVVELLLSRGADVDAVDDDGETALSFTARYSHPECTKVLLAAGAFVNTLSNEANTPLDLAREVLDTSTRVDRAKVLELLVAAGGLRWAQLEGSDSDSDSSSSSSSSSDDDNDDNDNEDEDDDGDSDFSALYTRV